LPFKEGSLVSPTAEIPMTTVSDTKIVRAYFSMNEKQVLYFNRTLKGSTTAES
jgi:membrane fusion protein (multidrug efflux system)